MKWFSIHWVLRLYGKAIGKWILVIHFLLLLRSYSLILMVRVDFADAQIVVQRLCVKLFKLAHLVR